MSISYELAPPEVHDVIRRVMLNHHSGLAEAEVRIDCLFALPPLDKNGDASGPAVKLGGYPCLAVIRVIALRDRAKGMGDAEIVIDKEEWEVLSEAQRDALIDHEITHLQLRVNEKGAIIRDDLGRPKLTLRLHDHQFGWFDEVAQRHGRDSVEVQQFERFQMHHEQQWLPLVTS